MGREVTEIEERVTGGNDRGGGGGEKKKKKKKKKKKNRVLILGDAASDTRGHHSQTAIDRDKGP